VGVNSNQLNIISKAKRYIKFEGGWHPIWLTRAKKYDIIQSDDMFQSNFFIRKINSIEQPQLLSWIEEKSFRMSPENPCKKDEIGFRPRCFLEILTATAESSPDNSLIVIPVNNAMFEVAMNLYCSLRNLQMHGAVMFWSIDAEVHQTFVSMGLLSYYSSEKFPVSIPNLQTWHKGSFSKIMRQKVDLWKMLLQADLDFWTLDADTVVLKDFRSIVLDSDADVHLSVDESNLLEATSYRTPVPNMGMGVAHFSSRPGTKLFLDMISEKLKETSWMEDQEAVNEILKKELLTTHSTINLLNYKVSKKWADLIAHVESQHTHVRKPVVRNRINIKLLDQMQFLNGHFFFSRTRAELRTHYSNFAVIHINGREDKIETFKAANLWIYDKNMCQDLVILRNNIASQLF
jgi:hypothetical protein